MIADRTSERVREKIARAAHRADDRVAFYRDTASALRSAVPFDGSCWITLDPATLLFTNHFSDDLPTEGFRHVCHNEYAEEDVNKFAALTRRSRNVGILAEATGDEPERSPRYRTILQPYGIEGELRASFVDGSSSWGCGIFLRGGDQPGFTQEEAAFVADLTGVIGHGFRTALLPRLLEAADVPAVPGVVLLDDHGRVDAVTPNAQRWLEGLAELEPPRTGPLPSVVLAVAATVRRITGQGETTDTARARARTAAGEWLVLHGSLLDTDAGTRIAVIIEPARSTSLAPLIAEAYGLTGRERDVVRLVLRGLSTERIAGDLHLSPWTVQDHLKSVFGKVGVRSRRELVAQVFFHQYEPRISDEPNLGPDGWFAAN